MRQGNFTLDNLMNYIYGEQISKIPTKLYNDDAQVKYLEFGSLYTYCCHGNKEHQIRRWLRERIAYVDSLLGYFTSQDDQVTVRMNKTGYVSFDITTYIPLYFSVKWSNATGGTQTIKMKRGETKTFYFTSTTATDQEVIIYHAQYIKRLDNLSNLNPSSCILANATKLTNVEIHSTELYNINVTNNKYLRSIDLENCSTLGTVTATGSSLDLSACKYLKYCNVYNTALTEVQLNSSGGSLVEIYYPKTVQSIQLIKQRLLETIGLPYGSSGEEVPTALYTINIQECPNIKYLNTSTDSNINTSFASMVYCNNLTIRNSLDLKELNFDGFYRLKNVIIENMYNLEQLGFNNLLPAGDQSTLQYIGMSNCPLLETIELNCTSDDYEITFADDAILNFGGLFGLKSIESNSVLKGLKTIIVPQKLESMYFTTDYGTGYSSVKNIWVSSVCTVNTSGSTAKATHVDSTFEGIDFAGMNLKNIDLGALVNIPKAQNFSLSPTSVNPHFNLNRDGETYPYLQPVGTLDLSNYTESLAKFFDGVDLDKLQIICTNKLPQTDLSYCFYNATFSNTSAITTLLSKVSSITNLDYCFYKTTIDSTDILGEISMGESSTMNYTFAECSNITSLKNVVIPSSVVGVAGMFYKCPLTTITNMTVNVKGSISGLFSGCTKLTTITTLRIPNVTDVSAAFDGCTNLENLTGFELPQSCTNVSNLFNGCYALTELSMNFGPNITSGDNWYPPNLEELNNTTISNDYVKLTNCSTLKSLNNITLSVSSMTDFLTGCSSLTSINGMDIGGTVTSVAALFSDTTLTTFSNVVFSSTITDFSYCFNNCTWLTDSHTITIDNTATNKNYYAMFQNCTKLTKVRDIDYHNKNCEYMYAQCKGISTLDLEIFNTSTCASMFNDCTGLTSAKVIIPDTCTSIEKLFYNCTSLTDISGSSFGSGITTVDNWSTNTNIKTANDITIKNNTINFSSNTNLTSCNNLLVTSTVTRLSNLFNGCTSLSSFSFNDSCNLSNITEMEKTFYIVDSLTEIDFKNLDISSVANMTDLIRKDKNNITIKNLRLTSTNCNYIGAFYYPWYFENIYIDNNNAIYVFGKGTTYPSRVKTITNLTFGEEVTDISGMFSGCVNLTHDLILPSHITNCTEAFKDCTSMTHAHSNWNNTYDSEITPTDCYAGCTGITHIDDVDVITYEGKEGLDEVPELWGGYEFSQEDTSVITVEIESDNYTLTTYPTQNDMGVITSWGDGSVDTLDYHTYTTAGTYVIKTKLARFNTSSTDVTLRDRIRKILQMRKIISSNFSLRDSNIEYLNLDNCEFRGDSFICNCTKLSYFSAKNFKLNSIYPLCAGTPFSSLLTEIIGVGDWDVSETTILSNLFAGSGITSIDLSRWTVSNVDNISYMFSNCKSLTSIDVSNWNTSKVTNLSGMFRGCTNLPTVTGIGGWDLSNCKSMNLMFYMCSSIQEIDTTNWSCGNNCTGVFQGCSSLTNIIGIENLVNSKCTACTSLFSGCKQLATIDTTNWDLSNITDFSNMFYQCNSMESLDLSRFDFTGVARIYTGMFGSCTKLSNLSLPSLIQGSTFNSMFSGCTSLTDLSGITFEDIAQTTESDNNTNGMSLMFYRCTNLEYLGTIINRGGMRCLFQGCNSLKYIEEFRFSRTDNMYDTYQIFQETTSNPNTIDINFTLDDGCMGPCYFTGGLDNNTWKNPDLSKDTVVKLFNCLSTYGGVTTYIGGSEAPLVLNSTTRARLTDDDIAIATAKGWSVS